MATLSLSSSKPDDNKRLYSTRQGSADTMTTATTPPLLDRDAWKVELNAQEMHGFLQTAEVAARAAGQVIVQHLGCANEVGGVRGDDEDDDTDQDANTHSISGLEIKTNIKDVVTQYDKEAQQAVLEILRTYFPTHSFLGEEDCDPGAEASEAALQSSLEQSSSGEGYVWICDPIDGTANFASGLSLCAVTICLVYKGTTVLGLIYDPHQDEMFTAIKGQGYCSLNGQPLPNLQKNNNAIADIRADVKNAIINAGCPADPNAFAVSMRGVMALNSRARGLRMIACSALTTAWIATGRLTAHFGYDLSCWDLAPGALLIQEAGGCVTDLDGSPYQLQTRNMLCSIHPQLHQDILNILQEADAISFVRKQ